MLVENCYCRGFHKLFLPLNPNSCAPYISFCACLPDIFFYPRYLSTPCYPSIHPLLTIHILRLKCKNCWEAYREMYRRATLNSYFQHFLKRTLDAII